MERKDIYEIKNAKKVAKTFFDGLRKESTRYSKERLGIILFDMGFSCSTLAGKELVDELLNKKICYKEEGWIFGAKYWALKKDNNNWSNRYYFERGKLEKGVEE